MSNNPHFYIWGLHSDGSNAMARNEWLNVEPFHTFREAAIFQEGAESAFNFLRVEIVAVQCDCTVQKAR